MSTTRLVLGIGNPLRSDDGLGWRVVQTLRDEGSSKARLIACHQLTPELAEEVSQADLVVFVDARADGALGEVRRQTLEPSARETAGWSLSHDLDPPTLLSHARMLFGRCPPACLLSVTAESFEPGETLSASVEAALPALLDALSEVLQDAC